MNFSPFGLLCAFDGRCLLVVLSERKAARDLGADLARRFGLTRAEAAVALALADGLTAAEIAERRGASVHTVRNQVKSALAKTESRRQSDLARLVEALRRP